MSEKKVHADHRKRMRQRFLDTGGAGFSSHELLELLLFGSVPRINTNPTAHKLIDRFGTVENVLSASADELQKVDGIGAASARLINVMGEACRGAFKLYHKPLRSLYRTCLYAAVHKLQSYNYRHRNIPLVRTDRVSSP